MSQGDRETAPLPSLWPSFLLCAVAAVPLSFGNLHRYHISDSLIPVLASLYRWTPFFWIQNRVGMVVPLLAVPIKDPLANLLFQSYLYVLTGLLAIFLLSRYVLRNRAYPVVATLSAAGFVAFAPGPYMYSFFLLTFYGVWLMLGSAGLVLLEPGADGTIPRHRQVLALLAFLVAHWAYSATAFLFVPLVLARHLLSAMQRHREVATGPADMDSTTCRHGPSWWQRLLRSETGLSLLVLALALLGGYLMMVLTPTPRDRTQLGPISISQWPRCWWGLVKNVWPCLAPYAWPWFLVCVAIGGGLLRILPSVRRHAGPARRASLALLGAGLLYQLFMGTQKWLFLAGLLPRYTLPGVFFLQAALVTFGAAPLCLALSQQARRWLSLAAAAALVGAAFVRCGLPSPARVRTHIDHLAEAGPAIVPIRCTHVAGGYWTVWPLVFRTNMELFDRGEDRVIWGITYRSEATRKLWSRVPPDGMRVCISAGDESEASHWLKEFHFPEMELVDRSSDLAVWRPLVNR